ncbi:MAG: hypothetical protein KBT47_02985, partial [Armatimonadetes bacterium]|nr:hypothetical protein [Candidatus Hippobium faecium]
GNNSGLTQNKYGFRSCMSTGMDVDLYLNSWDGAGGLDKSAKFIKDMIAEYRIIEDCFYGDYYPLIFSCIDHTGWNVYQMNKDDKGFVMAFRGEESPYNNVSLKLKGLDENKTYEFTDMDTGKVWIQKGSESLEIKTENMNESRLIRYALK